MGKPKVLMVATSRKTRGGITAVLKAYEGSGIWKKFHMKWIQTHRDGASWRKIAYLASSLAAFGCLMPFYDIAHVHLTADTSLKRKRLFVRMAKAMGKKVVLHFHPSGPQVFDKDENVDEMRKLISHCDRVIVLSPMWARILRDKLGVSERVEVLYNPCPDVRRSDEHEKYILFAGSMIRRKGYEDLIRAFAMIASSHGDWKVVFAGNGEIDRAREIARECGVAGQIEFLGWISGREKEEAFSHASIYCLASDGEGFPMGVLDAFAYGIPVVVTPVGGIPDIIKNGVNGMLYDVHDVDTLARKLEVLISDAELRRSLVKNADKHVSSTFDIDNLAVKLAGIYESL